MDEAVKFTLDYWGMGIPHQHDFVWSIVIRYFNVDAAKVALCVLKREFGHCLMFGQFAGDFDVFESLQGREPMEAAF